MEVHVLKAFTDNYIYVIDTSQGLIVIDPGQAQPILDFIERTKKKLLAILVTHHHLDHIQGVEQLLSLKPKLYGPKSIQDLGKNFFALEEGQYKIEGLDCLVIETPGHTLDHLIYYFPQLKALFSGDTLFSAGCGRLFEGTSEQMVASLNKIKQLPLDTNIYFGHEYTHTNLRFALTVDPMNNEIKKYLDKTKRVTTPTTLQQELSMNPFLRLEEDNIKKHLHMDNKSSVDIFSQLRSLKDAF